MKRKFLFYFLFVSFIPFLFGAGNEPVTTLPDSNQSTFRTQSRAYWKDEIAAIHARYFPNGWIYSGGIHSTSGTMISSAFATEAFTSLGRRVTADNASGSVAINYTTAGCIAADVAWVMISGMSANSSGNFARVGTSNYFVDCVSVAKPTLPSDSTWLMQVTITASAIAAVTDLRNFNPVIPAFTTAQLPAAGNRGALARVLDGILGLFLDNGSQWVSLSHGYADVKMFGAVGDCSTDDTASFVAAYGAAKKVLVPDPSSCYKITSALTLPANTMLFGANKRTTKIQKFFNGDLLTLGDGAGFSHIYLEGDGDNYSGKGVVLSGTNGRQIIEHSRILNNRSAAIDIATSAGSQSSFHDIDMWRWDIATHAIAVTGSGLYAVVISPTQQLSAVPRKFSDIESGGSPAFDFGGSNDTYLSNAFVGDLLFNTESRGVHVVNTRWANQAAANLDGHNNTIVGCGIAPQLTIVASSDDWHIQGNSLNNPPIIDNSATYQNNIDQFNVTYTPSWTASAGTQPSLGNGDLRGSYTRNGNVINVSVELTIGSTTTVGDAGVWRFAMPTTYYSVAGRSQTALGVGYARDTSVPAQVLLVPAIISGTSYAVVNYSGGIQLTYNLPYTWATGDIIRFTLSYTM